MQHDEPTMASMGSFIIDDIIYTDGKKVCNVLGGAGIFAIYGMRLWQPNELAKNVGYIIHKGFDYPEEIGQQVDSLNISLISKTHPDLHTTRGLNTFGENDHRDFEYIHPIIRATTEDFPDNWIKSVKILHIISAPERAIEIVTRWKERETELQSPEATQFLWEPLPWACLPENIDIIYQATQLVDIVTPNHEELAALLGLDINALLIENKNDIKRTVEDCSQKFLDGMTDTPNKKVLVVRSSKYGAMITTNQLPSVKDWVPAYWNWKTDTEHVVDVTGAGNTFCGGFAYGWIKTNGTPTESALYGAVSASYTVEQIGVPVLFDKERWNSGQTPQQRLDILKTKSCIFI